MLFVLNFFTPKTKMLCRKVAKTLYQYRHSQTMYWTIDRRHACRPIIESYGTHGLFLFPSLPLRLSLSFTESHNIIIITRDHKFESTYWQKFSIKSIWKGHALRKFHTPYALIVEYTHTHIYICYVTEIFARVPYVCVCVCAECRVPSEEGHTSYNKNSNTVKAFAMAVATTAVLFGNGVRGMSVYFDATFQQSDLAKKLLTNVLTRIQESMLFLWEHYYY